MNCWDRTYNSDGTVMTRLQVSRDRVVSPPERFIKIADDRLLEYFQGVFGPEHSEELSALYQLIEGITGHEFTGLRRRLEGDFAYFSAAATGDGDGVKAKGLHESRLADQERRFLNDFCGLMASAHYRLLGREVWEAAQSEEFLFTLPVAVDWDALDDFPLRRHWAEHYRERAELPELADRILIFHRGVDVAKMRGLYLWTKLDLLLSFYLLQPLWAAVGWVIKALGLRAPGGLPMMGGARESKEAVASLPAHRSFQAVGNVARAAMQLKRAANAARARQGAVLEEGSVLHEAAVIVERRTLNRAFPTGRAVLRKLLRPVELQEACFTDTVVLYRRRVGAGEAAGAGGEKEIIKEVEPEVLARNLHIKHFKGIPLADLEMVVPEKKIYVPPSVFVQLAVAAVAALGGLFWSLWGTEVSLGVLGSAVVLLVTRASQVYLQAQSERAEIEREMNKLLFERTAASQEAVLHTLTEEMSRQRVRELLVCYCVLAQAAERGPIPDEELDRRCERLLRKSFGLRIDFTAEQAIPALLSWGLVRRAPLLPPASPRLRGSLGPLGLPPEGEGEEKQLQGEQAEQGEQAQQGDLGEQQPGQAQRGEQGQQAEGGAAEQQPGDEGAAVNVGLGGGGEGPFGAEDGGDSSSSSSPSARRLGWTGLRMWRGQQLQQPQGGVAAVRAERPRPAAAWGQGRVPSPTKLSRASGVGVASSSPGQGGAGQGGEGLVAVPLQQALMKLDEVWDGLFDFKIPTAANSFEAKEPPSPPSTATTLLSPSSQRPPAATATLHGALPPNPLSQAAALMAGAAAARSRPVPCAAAAAQPGAGATEREGYGGRMSCVGEQQAQQEGYGGSRGHPGEQHAQQEEQSSASHAGEQHAKQEGRPSCIYSSPTGLLGGPTEVTDPFNATPLHLGQPGSSNPRPQSYTAPLGVAISWELEQHSPRRTLHPPRPAPAWHEDRSPEGECLGGVGSGTGVQSGDEAEEEEERWVVEESREGLGLGPSVLEPPMPASTAVLLAEQSSGPAGGLGRVGASHQQQQQQQQQRKQQQDQNQRQQQEEQQQQLQQQKEEAPTGVAGVAAGAEPEVPPLPLGSSAAAQSVPAGKAGGLEAAGAESRPWDSGGSRKSGGCRGSGGSRGGGSSISRDSRGSARSRDSGSGSSGGSSSPLAPEQWVPGRSHKGGSPGNVAAAAAAAAAARLAPRGRFQEDHQEEELGAGYAPSIYPPSSPGHAKQQQGATRQSAPCWDSRPAGSIACAAAGRAEAGAGAPEYASYHVSAYAGLAAPEQPAALHPWHSTSSSRGFSSGEEFVLLRTPFTSSLGMGAKAGEEVEDEEEAEAEEGGQFTSLAAAGRASSVHGRGGRSPSLASSRPGSKGSTRSPSPSYSRSPSPSHAHTLSPVHIPVPSTSFAPPPSPSHARAPSRTRSPSGVPALRQHHSPSPTSPSMFPRQGRSPSPTSPSTAPRPGRSPSPSPTSPSLHSPAPAKQAPTSSPGSPSHDGDAALRLLRLKSQLASVGEAWQGQGLGAEAGQGVASPIRGSPRIKAAGPTATG